MKPLLVSSDFLLAAVQLLEVSAVECIEALRQDTQLNHICQLSVQLQYDCRISLLLFSGF